MRLGPSLMPVRRRLSAAMMVPLALVALAASAATANAMGVVAQVQLENAPAQRPWLAVVIAIILAAGAAVISLMKAKREHRD